MKVAIRGGHNYLAVGASALVSEVEENRKIYPHVISYLKLAGCEVLDVTPGNMDSNSDLAYGVKKANDWGADVFVSIHLNKAYNSYNGAIGTETIVYSTTDQYNDEVYAKRIVDNLGKLGFKNRGVKTNPALYELKNTKMPSIITECFFVEATEDVALYKKLGAEALGKAIAEGIVGKTINKPTSNNTSTSTDGVFYRVVAGSFSDRTNAENMVNKLKGLGVNSFIDVYKK